MMPDSKYTLQNIGVLFPQISLLFHNILCQSLGGQKLT